ncbi:MAG: exodeoxyribonuclease VII small subunit [Burkholderiales bacterium]|jgi:exodeoxyribonuclease VII small subunit|nr:exodeoxyribonuclease VII small subunit [Burkholderiales bacterium]
MSSTTQPETQTAIATLSFEQALEELDLLVRQMESGELSLDASIAAYRRGADLAQHCQGKLAIAEQEIAKLDGDVLKPLDASELRGAQG